MKRSEVAVLAGVATGFVCVLVLIVRDRRRKKQDQEKLRLEVKDLRRDVLRAISILESLQARLGIKDNAQRPSAGGSDETSDDVFFEALEDELALSEVPYMNGDVPHEGKVDPFYDRMDALIGSTKDEDFQMAYELLKQKLIRDPSNAELLKRIAAAAFLFSGSFFSTDPDRRQALVTEAKDAALLAEKQQPNDYFVHKWCALTLGTMCDFVGINQKIQFGFQFKDHLDAALALCPTDKLLHHMLGRWAYEVANISWWERKAAATLFSNPPTATYEEALESLMAVESLCEDPWKENRLTVAKVHLAKSDKTEARQWLNSAYDLPVKTTDDEIAHQEVEELLNKL